MIACTVSSKVAIFEKNEAIIKPGLRGSTAKAILRQSPLGPPDLKEKNHGFEYVYQI